MGIQRAEPAQAQSPGLVSGECELRSYEQLRSQELALGQRVVHVVRALIACPDGSWIRSDEATHYGASGLNVFRGSVVYQTVEWRLEGEELRVDPLGGGRLSSDLPFALMLASEQRTVRGVCFRSDAGFRNFRIQGEEPCEL